MASVTTPWRRWQDWVTAAAGGFLALSPSWFDIGTAGTWAMVTIGAAMVVLGVTALYMPGLMADEGLAVAAGVAAFVAPWLFSFADYAEGRGPRGWSV